MKSEEAKEQDGAFNKKLQKETGWSIATKGITFPLFFLLNIILARSMGPDLFGAWSYFYSFFSIALLFSFFGVRASNKFLAEYNHTPYLGEIIKKVITLRVVSGLIFALALFLLATPVSILIERPEFATYFRWSSVMLFFLSYTEFLKGAFAGLHRIKYNFLVNCLEHGTKLLLVAAVVYSSTQFVPIIQAITAAAAIASVIATYVFIKDFYKKGQSFGDRAIMRELIDYSIPLMLISIGFLIATEIDTLMLGRLATDREVGMYAIAKQLITKLPHISMAIAMGSMPVFARMNLENRDKLRKLFTNLLKANAAIFSFVIAGIFLSAWFFIPLLYGEAFSPSILPLKILCIYLLTASFLSYFNSFLDYRGLAKRRMYNLFFSTFINIGLNYWLIPIYGATGAAIATSVSYLPYLALNVWETREAFRSVR